MNPSGLISLMNEAQTARLAASIAQAFQTNPLTIALSGPLGAGKSSFARALLKSLGVRGHIRSPTFTLVERYPTVSGIEAMHADLYRLGSPSEVHELGLEEPVTAWRLIEWPERGQGAIPEVDLWLALDYADPGRSARLRARPELQELLDLALGKL